MGAWNSKVIQMFFVSLVLGCIRVWVVFSVCAVGAAQPFVAVASPVWKLRYKNKQDPDGASCYLSPLWLYLSMGHKVAEVIFFYSGTINFGIYP